MKRKQPKIALVYDRVNSWGGAERVLLELHRLYPAAPLYTSVYEPEAALWAEGWDIRTSWLQHIPWARRRHQWFGWLMPLLFESFDLSEFDLVISITSEAAKAVITRPDQLHVCYLLTPTRYIWSHAEEYSARLPAWLKPPAKTVLSALRAWDRVAAQRPDVIVPISRQVGQRARRYYRRQVEDPLYPPFRPLPREKAPLFLPAKKFVFSWGRHVAYKKFDALLKACHLARTELVLAGSGPDTPRLLQIARRLDPVGERLHFVGQLSEGELHWYARRAAAAVFPQIEDFGIVVMEAQLVGCPVVVHHASGAAELVTKKTALILTDGRMQTLVSAIRRARRKTWNRLDIQQTARQYAGVYFARRWRRFIREMKERHGK